MIFDDYSYLVHGDILPDVKFEPIENGQIHRVKKGHIVLLNFFIIPCKHCKHMLEYLQEEIRLLTPRWRVEQFLTDVDELRADVERLEQRVERLRRSIKSPTSA